MCIGGLPTYICLYEGIRSLELELWTVVIWAWELNPGPLEEQLVLLTFLTSESSLQPLRNTL